jgi:hypothetical protein
MLPLSRAGNFVASTPIGKVGSMAVETTSNVVTGTFGGVSKGLVAGLSSLMFALMLAGVWLTTTSALDGTTDWYIYSLAVGATNIGIGGLFVLMSAWKPDFFTRESYGGMTYMTLLTLFILLWNGVGAFLITFIDPYTTLSTANGYFSAWSGFLVSLYAFNKSSDGVKISFLKGATTNLLVQFVAQLAIVLGSIKPVEQSRKNAMYGIIAAGVLAALALVLMFWKPQRRMVHIIIHLGFLCVNIASAGLLTFDGWVNAAGNVYFAIYIAVFFSVVAFGEALVTDKIVNSGSE